ncbi:MAG: AAA family ATPase [Desulfobaccales bacterium]
MYEAFYGFRERPFSLVPDPEFLYLSPQHRLARAYLEYGLSRRTGVVVLSGEIGTGKTTLIRDLLAHLPRRQRLAVLYQTATLSGEELLDLVLLEFGLRGQFAGRAARLGALNRFLSQALAQGEPAVLIVDEAQNLGAGALEEVRLLSNLTQGKEPLLQIILVGQPGLRRLLSRPELRQLAQRVTVHYHLEPLDAGETAAYIRHRLRVAGGPEDLFTEAAVRRLHELTGGVPRRLNTLCDLLLVAGFAEGRRQVDADLVEQVAAAHPPLEGTGAEEPEPEAAPPEVAAGNGHLAARMAELTARLSRLEGLVLDLSHDLVPLLTGRLRSAEPPGPETPEASPPPPAETSEAAAPPPRRRRWLPWRRKREGE